MPPKNRLLSLIAAALLLGVAIDTPARAKPPAARPGHAPMPAGKASQPANMAHKPKRKPKPKPKRHRFPHVKMTERDWRRIERVQERAAKAAGTVASSFLSAMIDPDNAFDTPTSSTPREHHPEHREPKEDREPGPASKR